jgi:hypothetical protein
MAVRGLFFVSFARAQETQLGWPSEVWPISVIKPAYKSFFIKSLFKSKYESATCKIHIKISTHANGMIQNSVFYIWKYQSNGTGPMQKYSPVGVPRFNPVNMVPFQSKFQIRRSIDSICANSVFFVVAYCI